MTQDFNGSLHYSESWSRRTTTVQILYNKLSDHYLIQVS